MPTYDYGCPKCEHKFSETRGIRDYSSDPSSVCPKCGHKCGSEDRDFSKSRPQFIGTSVQNAEYNPGLGCVIKNKHHKEEILREKGLHEVGNDFGSSQKMQDHYRKKKQEELDTNWNKDPGDFFL